MRVFKIIISLFSLFLLVTFLVSCNGDKVVTTEGIVFEKIEDKDEYAVEVILELHRISLLLNHTIIYL